MINTPLDTRPKKYNKKRRIEPEVGSEPTVSSLLVLERTSERDGVVSEPNREWLGPPLRPDVQPGSWSRQGSRSPRPRALGTVVPGLPDQWPGRRWYTDHTFTPSTRASTIRHSSVVARRGGQCRVLGGLPRPHRSFLCHLEDL